MSAIRRFLLMLALTMMWSPSFLFIKLALADFQPLTIAALRVSLGGLLVLAVLYYKGGVLPRQRLFWLHASVMALVSSVVPFYLFAYAEQSIESALAAILNGTSPMFTVLLTLLFLPSERLTFQKIVGVGLSAGGLFLLFAPNIANGLTGSFGGILAGTAASISYSLSHIYGKKYISQQKPFVAPAAQLLMSALFLVPLALIFEQPLSRGAPSWQAIMGVLGLACFGTALAFMLYYKLLEHSGPTAISTVACFFPAGGMLLGFLFLDESFTLLSCFASLLILSGLMILNELFPSKKPEKVLP